MKTFDVVLVGSGISCLTAAAILAKHGHRVCVIEQHTKAGGYLHCFQRFGIRFDTGSHYIGAMDPGQSFRAMLEYMGVYSDDIFVPMDPEGFDVLNFPSFEFAIPKGYPAFIERLSALFPNDRQAIGIYCDRIQSVVAQFPTYSFNENYDTMAVARAMDTPLLPFLKSLTSNRKLISVLLAYCAVHGVLPEHISLGLHSLITDSFIQGPYGFAKGGEALTNSFVRRIEEGGGVVLTKKRVTRLVVENRKVVAVELASGESFNGDWVIYGGHPKNLLALTGESAFSPAFTQRVKGLKETVGIFGIYGRCTQNPGLSAMRNYYYFGSEDVQDLLTEDFNPLKPPVVYVTRTYRDENSSIFPISLHSPCYASSLQEWEATRTARRPKEYYQRKKEIAEAVFATVEARHPGFRANVAEYDTSTPLTNVFFNGSAEGSAYGIYHSMAQTGARALGPRTHILNLLLTGQNTLAPGLLGAAVSGLRTAGHVVGIGNLLSELRKYR